MPCRRHAAYYVYLFLYFYVYARAARRAAMRMIIIRVTRSCRALMTFEARLITSGARWQRAMIVEMRVRYSEYHN